uniref:Hrs_helical domain-containing protein n=1 Tax=Steinernema glaseri TaxID=37863 RepID=A0A1I7Y9V5_9BILA
MQKQRELLNYYNGTESVTDISSTYGDALNMSTASTTALNGHGVPPIYKSESFPTSDHPPAKSVSEENCVEPGEYTPELSHYLDRNYWKEQRNISDNKTSELKASAPPPSELSFSGSVSTMTTPVPNAWTLERKLNEADLLSKANGDAYGIGYPGNSAGQVTDADVEETARFCHDLEQQVTIMDNRIRSNLNRGRSIINDTSIQSLFIKVAGYHANVIHRTNDLDEKREYYEQLQDRIAHISEARLAINALREDHMQQKHARELAEQQERQRQMQEKLQFMRNKKQEMLVYQRHLALQKFQQQEQEMQMRRMHPAAWGVRQESAPNPAQFYGASYWTPNGTGTATQSTSCSHVLSSRACSLDTQSTALLSTTYGCSPNA